MTFQGKRSHDAGIPATYVDHLTEILKSALDGGVFTQEDKDIMEFIQGVESGKEPLREAMGTSA